MTVMETFSDLTTPATADFLHCCASPTANAGAALPFIGFPAAINGTYNNTFDLTAAGTYTALFINNNGGTAAGAEATLLAGIDAGLAYVNIHDSTFPGGEIRGQLGLVSTPEPSTLVLIGTGLLTLVGTVFRRPEQR
jgi:CHRD domain-containing protein/PEP-CTERM motif-containing protein